MRSTTATDRGTGIGELAARLRRLEDERDITRLIASYGPAVDAGDSDAAARRWAADGTYDVDGWLMEGRADVRAMLARRRTAVCSTVIPTRMRC